jgi:TPR repeat protein
MKYRIYVLMLFVILLLPAMACCAEGVYDGSRWLLDDLWLAEAHDYAAVGLLAGKGDAQEQRHFALMNYFGHGVNPNKSEAARWFLKAARQGDIGAKAWVGSMYAKGDVLGRSPAEAIKWLQAPAEQGDPGSAKILFTIYDQGSDEVPRNEILASQWAKKSRENAATLKKSLAEYYAARKAVDSQKVEDFRLRLDVGTETQYGMIIEMKRPIAKVQTKTGERWFKVGELLPKS